jgi:uncharacterized membrane protein
MIRGRAGVANASRAFFAIVMIGLGIQGLITRDFAPIWPPVPVGVPARAALIFLCALAPLAAGLGLLVRRTAAISARVLFGYFVLWLLLVRIPLLVTAFAVNTWWSACQIAAMVAASWVLYAWFATDRDRRRLGSLAGEGGVRIARALYGIALIPFGLAHFLYLEATAPLVPHWMGWPVGWSYLTGAAFIVAGMAVLAGVWARLAAALVALQMFLFTLLVWVPIVVAGAANESQWGEFVVSWALIAAGWVMAESYRGVPWLAVGKR